MRKSVTKVIILMLIIPLLLIFSMNTAIDMTAIMLDSIPVTKVEIEGEKILFVDVNGENNTVKLNAIVSPKEATNQKVSYSTQAINSDKLAEVNISNDGLVTPKSVGTVKVIATADGGRQDSVQINFFSTLASEITNIRDSINLNVGESYTISLGTDYTIYPYNSTSSITFTSNNNKVRVDKYTGEITGLFVGESIVTATVEGIKYDETSNKFIETTYSIDFKVNIESDKEQEIFSFAGGLLESQEIISLNNKTIPFAYLGYNSLGELSYSVEEDDKQYIESVEFEYYDDAGNIVVTLKEDAPEKEYIITIKAQDSELAKLTIVKQLPTIEISTPRTIFAKSNANVLFGSIVNGIESGYIVRYVSDNPNVFSVNTKDNDCIGKARNEGKANIKAILYINDEQIAVSNPIEFSVVNPYISIGIVEATKTYGLENRFVLGKYKYDGNTTISSYKPTIMATSADGIATDIDNNKLKWSSSDNNIATVSDNGTITVINDGIVTISVSSVYDQVLGTSTITNFEISCRKNGLNVVDYTSLVWANENNYETVLLNDVMLADGINSSNYVEYLSNIATKSMMTTADKAYYEDNNKSDDAKIKYCLEITSNIYGNGFAIDANNITRSIDKYNYSIFNGPLDLVALKYGNNSSNNARVKAQDNIVFLVRKDNISINNVELKGCSDSSLLESGKTNLGKLNNVGTVLEIVGDNTTISYSRVNNGRTVVRIYGSAHESDTNKLTTNLENYKTETLINNCILTNAREFILKVGSNQLLRNDSVIGKSLVLPNVAPEEYDHAAPYLTKENGSNYNLNSDKDDYFINNYLMNDITLQDTVFYGAGLFCIGFDTQFAGLALHGYDYGSYTFSTLGWKRVAGTSYPARIKMKGDVRFYDWKEVTSVDSSTLVEGDTSLLETIGLDLNVSNLLNKYNQESPSNKVVYKFEGNDYINGAIVFYGGGKNYSWIDTSEVNSNFNSLDEFEIPLSYFGERDQLIYYAAGKEDFRFMTYSSEGNLNYETQRNELADGSAYSWIIRK